jgi:phage baseplate assembly protein W
MARDFKSVGEQTSARRFQVDNNEVPIGIKTPMELGQSHAGIVAMHTSLRDQIGDNLRNLILTNRGERVGLYDFGADLRELSMERGRDDFETEAIIRIRRAVSKYMPYVDLQTFESTSVLNRQSGLIKVRIRVTYGVPTLGIASGLIEVILFVAG